MDHLKSLRKQLRQVGLSTKSLKVTRTLLTPVRLMMPVTATLRKKNPRRRLQLKGRVFPRNSQRTRNLLRAREEAGQRQQRRRVAVRNQSMLNLLTQRKKLKKMRARILTVRRKRLA